MGADTSLYGSRVGRVRVGVSTPYLMPDFAFCVNFVLRIRAGQGIRDSEERQLGKRLITCWCQSIDGCKAPPYRFRSRAGSGGCFRIIMASKSRRGVRSSRVPPLSGTRASFYWQRWVSTLARRVLPAPRPFCPDASPRCEILERGFFL